MKNHMKNLSLIFLFLALTAILPGCTLNQRAKQFGGTMTIKLPKGRKLVNASWKGEDLWYLTRQMKEDEQPETSTMIEDSSYGVVSGEVIFEESK